MAPVLAFRPTMTTDSPLAANAAGLAICPGCQTADSMTMAAVVAGGAWQCARCAQRWDLDRLATVGNYIAWVAARAEAPPTIVKSPNGDTGATRSGR